MTHLNSLDSMQIQTAFHGSLTFICTSDPDQIAEIADLANENQFDAIAGSFEDLDRAMRVWNSDPPTDDLFFVLDSSASLNDMALAVDTLAVLSKGRGMTVVIVHHPATAVQGITQTFGWGLRNFSIVCGQ